MATARADVATNENSTYPSAVTTSEPSWIVRTLNCAISRAVLTDPAMAAAYISEV